MQKPALRRVFASARLSYISLNGSGEQDRTADLRVMNPTL